MQNDESEPARLPYRVLHVEVKADCYPFRPMGVEQVFRRRLRELIKQRYGSIDRMYLESGISKGHIAALLNGKYSPTLKTVERFAKALEVEVVELLQPSGGSKG